jgi:hypothetical protein
MAKRERNNPPPATPATTKIFAPPQSFAEAEAFALYWLQTKLEVEGTGWQVEWLIKGDDEGNFVSLSITKQFFGFDLEQEVEKAIQALKYDKPIEESKGTILHVLQERRDELERKVGRPTGSAWAGDIWQIANLLRSSGFPLSRNPESPETSGFDAIANAMRALGIAPNSYSGVKANFYDFAKRHGLS